MMHQHNAEKYSADKSNADSTVDRIDALTGQPSHHVLIGSLDEFLQRGTSSPAIGSVNWRTGESVQHNVTTASNNIGRPEAIADLKMASAKDTAMTSARLPVPSHKDTVSYFNSDSDVTIEALKKKRPHHRSKTRRSQKTQTKTTNSIASGVYNSDYGYGLVDAAAAVSQTPGKTTAAAKPITFDGDGTALKQINATGAWSQGYTGQGVVVAVVDSGVDYNHVDLSGNIWTNTAEIPGNGIDDDHDGYIDDVHGWDFVDNDNTPTDKNGHGTHVAGTIAAENNGTGITGVAYNAKIMPVRVLDTDGSGDTSTIAQGVTYAVNHGAKVINLSLGGQPSPEIAQAILTATQKGAVVVMAAGNEGANQPTSPADLSTYTGIAVGAVDSSDQLTSFTDQAGYQPKNYVDAPGVNILSTEPNSTYGYKTGTSMATAYVSGVAALIFSANPKLTAAQVTSILTQTANSKSITV